MKRYSYLYGTTWVSEKAALESGARGHIANVGESEKLRPFLLKQGAADAALVMTTVQNMLGGIVMHGMHKENLPQVSPMSVRFAPMYLHRREDMPNNMKPLNAICISGFENRDNNRNGTYSHTVFMSLPDLRGDEEFNYLDVLFGTHRTTWQDMLDHVMSKDDFFIDCDAMPVKVTPILDERDMKQVIYAAAALYAGRSVIMRVENRYEFNDRAWNILTQVFSLLNPHILSEVGFSTYDTPDRIRQLLRDTGIRLFVTTQDKTPEELSTCADIVIDMETADIYGEESVAPPAQVLEAVQYWYGLPWDARRNILDAQMKDVMLFQNGIPFAEATTAFASDPFHQWCNDESVDGTVTSLEQLQEIYHSFPICTKIPMMHELFAARVPELLPEDVTLSDLAAQTYDAYRHAKKAEEKEKYQALYEFALELGQIDAPPVAEKAAATERRIGKENLEALRQAAQQELEENAQAHAQEMADTKAAHAQEMADTKATHAKEMADTQAAHATAMAAADAKFQNAVTEHAQAMAASEAAHAQAIENVKTAARTAVEAEQTKAREELAAQQAKADQAIAEEQNKRKESERQAMESIQKIQGEKEAVEQDLQTVKGEKAELDTKLSVTVEALTAKEQEAAGLTEQLQQEKANSADLTVKLEQKSQEYDQAQETIRQNQEEAEKVLAEEKEKHIKTKKAYRHMKEQYENAVGTAEFKDAKRKQLIAAGLGFGVAALILGAVLLIVLLVGRGDAAPTVTTTAPTTVVTTAPTTAPTTEPTTAPTTEPPTEPTEPPVVLPEWSEELAAELEQELADLGVLMYGEAAATMQQTMAGVLPEEYSVIAAFMETSEVENTEENDLFMILQAADLTQLPAEGEATSGEETEEADEAEQETTAPATTDGEQTQEEAAVEKTPIEKLWDYCQRDGVPMMLATDRYAILIHGDAETVELAKAVFARLVGEGESVFTGMIAQAQEQTAG